MEKESLSNKEVQSVCPVCGKELAEINDPQTEEAEEEGQKKKEEKR